MSAEEAPELRPYPIQLASVACAEVSGQKRPLTELDRPDPQLDITLLRTPLSEDATSFSCRLDVKLGVVAGDGFAECRVLVQGDFLAVEPISPEVHEHFAEYTPVALLWPYARVYLGELGQMLGVLLGPLPTLDSIPPPAGAANAQE